MATTTTFIGEDRQVYRTETFDFDTSELVIDEGGVITREPVTPERLARAIASADKQDRRDERTALSADLQTIKDERDQARDNRLEMVEADPSYLNKWNDTDVTVPADLTGTGNQSVRITALEAAVNDLQTRHVDVAKLANATKNQVRSLWGTSRLTLANLVRAIRAGQLDA